MKVNQNENDNVQPNETAEPAAANETESTDCKTGKDGEEASETPAEKTPYDELMDRYQRSLAEFDNFRKRTVREKATLYDEGLRDAIEKLLPIIDNFERALATGENKDDNFYQGISMIARQIGAYLSEAGVVPIAAKGEAFNHNLHFAVAHVEDAQYGSNEVIEELQKGYMHKDKVIRPSMVKVAN